MRASTALLILSLAIAAPAKLLVDYSAARDDDVSKMGLINLEKARDEREKQNIPDLYVKSDKDWQGTKCAHFHRKKGYIRAEMHALNGETKAGETYFITYSFSLGAIPDSLLVFQWKEYVANNEQDGGANIPLSLQIRDSEIHLDYQASNGAKRVTQWKSSVKTETVNKVGLEILAKKSGGYIKLYYNGKQVTFLNGEKSVTGNMFPGRSDPKIGIYGGEEVETDNYVYRFQVATEKKDVDQSFF